MDLLQRFKDFIKKEDLFQPKDTLLLAVSGGVDSVVLCELCRQAGYDFSIAHCNFQLRGADSDRDEKFVQQLAERYGVPFYVRTFDTVAIAKEQKTSIEETARNLRYNWFCELIANAPAAVAPIASWIVTAHHADDNIETVAMNFFRGTGIKGLRGILPKQQKIIRPLLFARREELELFLKDNQLSHVTDHTNLQDEYTRNHFRNNIIPLAEKNFPGAKENMLKNISRFKEVEKLYEQSILSHKIKLLEQKGNEFHIPVLKLLKTTPLITVLYEIIKDFDFTAQQAEEAVGLLQSESGKWIRSSTHRILRNRKWLIISPIQTDIATNIIIEEEDTVIKFAAAILTFKKIPIEQHQLQSVNSIAQLDAGELSYPLLLRKWKQGDYFYPLGMQKKKKLSRFFIDQKLSLIEKENTWVIEMNKKIIWVVNRRIDDRFKVTGKTKTVLVISYT